MKRVLVLAYPGSGKTYLAENFENVSDLEFQHYRWDYGEYKNLPLEQLKGRKDIRKLNPNWPDNFFEILDKELKKHEIVLVPMATSLFKKLDELKSQGVRIIFAIQSKDRFNETLEAYEQRGNSQEFIEARINDFEKFYKIVENTGFEKVYIQKGEYLSEALCKLGIKLKPGKGYKNYK